ncbi:MAG: serine hydrolase [Acidimicrobiales bacterium]
MSTLRRTFVSGPLCLMTALILGTGTAATGSPTTAAPAHRAVSFDAPGQASVRPHDSGNCSNMATLAKCVMKILAPAGGIHGVYLQRIGGSVLASDNASYPFEPASSIKPVIALYAITQVEKGLAHLSDRVPRIDESGGREDCPPDTFSGTEPLGTALQQMMEVSDNNRTDELMQYFGVAHLNAFATSLGMRHTRFHTSPIPPGFNVIGCLSYGYDPLPHTVDGNTMSLADASKLWAAVAALPAPYAEAFYELAAGRDMNNSQGYDFTGIWPSMTTIAMQEAPAALSSTQTQQFIDHMSVSVKGGNYWVVDCATTPCREATWWVFAGSAQIPGCSGTTMTHTPYTWGYFVSDAVEASEANPDDTVAASAFYGASGQLLAAPIAQGLAHWWRCSPKHDSRLGISAKAVSTGTTVNIATALATVTDSDRTDISPDLDGLINWGDATATSDATLSGGSGRFTVYGWHAYRKKGTYTVRVRVLSLESGRSATVKVTLKVT